MKNKTYFYVPLMFFSFLIFVWFLKFNYKIRFKTHHAPLSVYFFLDNTNSKMKYTDGIVSLETDPLESSKISFQWEITPTENGSYVETSLILLQNSFYEKIKILSKKSELFDESLLYIESFRDNLVKDYQSFRWNKPVIDSLDSALCLCINISSKISEKANQMNKNIDALAEQLFNQNKNPPRLYIHELDIYNQTLNFDFCFPISNTTKPLKVESPYFIKTFEKIEGNSIRFFGNYGGTYRGWFSMLANIENLNKNLSYPFVEVFFDSPFSGSSDKEWMSKTYYMIK